MSVNGIVRRSNPLWTSVYSRPDTLGVPDLKLQMLSKHFAALGGRRIHAVDCAYLNVEDGELLALVGPSATGQTTLLRLIAGLDEPDEGQILVGERNITRVPAPERDVGMVFQTLALYPHMTVAQNIDFGLRLRRTPKNEIRNRVHEVAERLSLQECMDRRPFELSGGQRQRVALARALVRRPGILLLDEPFSHLDGMLRRQLCGELKTLHAEFRLTILLVTHDLAEAAALARRMAVMNAGRIEQVGSVEVLRLQPATPFVAEFMKPGFF